jgi:tetratricopeptide (TPR) repeat protein
VRALLATITLGLLAPVAHPDEIALFQGAPRRAVVVTAESAATLTFEPESGGAPETLPTARVRAVVHDRTSDAFRGARAAAAAGRFETAARLYLSAAKAIADATVPVRSLAWERPTGLFRAAECRRALGRDDEAAALLRELLDELPTTRFRGAALDRLARIALAVGDVAGARARLEQLRDDALRAGLGRRWQLRAYVAFESRASEYPDVKNLARLRAGRLRLAGGQHERAQVFFADAFAERERVGDESGDALAIAAGASNGLALARIASSDATAEDHRAALDAFLRTLVVYGTRLGHSDLAAEALVGAARELERSGEPEDLARARRLAERCLREYPATRFAQAAVELAADRSAERK